MGEWVRRRAVRSGWRRPAFLVAVVLAVAAGVLGMHVLSVGHGVHTSFVASPSAPPSAVVDSTSVEAFSAHMVPAHPHGSDAHGPDAHDSGTDGLGAHCETGCASQATAMCLAVLVLGLALLRRGYRPHTQVRAGSTASGSGTDWIPRVVPRLAPDLNALCVSRT